MAKILQAFYRDERGVSALEYAVMAAVVVAALAAGSTVFSSSLQSMISNTFSLVNRA